MIAPGRKGRRRRVRDRRGAGRPTLKDRCKQAGSRRTAAWAVAGAEAACGPAGGGLRDRYADDFGFEAEICSNINMLCLTCTLARAVR